jgi:hypothetical protein
LKNATEIIGIAWNFYRKQPVLNQIAFWLFFAPVGLIDAISGMIDTVAAQSFNTGINTMEQMTAMEFAITIPIVITLVYLMVWGHICVLMVSKKMLSSSAGRSRSSFKAVRDQSKKFIIPLLLVGILRSITALLWMLLLIVPGVIYSIRTVFYDIMMIEEGKVIYGREMLTKSTNMVKGHGWDIFVRLLIIGVCIFGSTGLVSAALQIGLSSIDYRLENLAIILIDAIDAYAGMFFMVCTVALYAEFKKLSPTK